MHLKSSVLSSISNGGMLGLLFHLLFVNSKSKLFRFLLKTEFVTIGHEMSLKKGRKEGLFVYPSQVTADKSKLSFRILIPSFQSRLATLGTMTPITTTNGLHYDSCFKFS